MSKALITDGYLTDIANAIRAKNGSADTYTPPQMAAAIADIPTGSDVDVEPLNVTQNGTYTAPSGKAYSPVTALVPNTYAAGDEGKVVQNGALVAQTSRTLTQNGTYDTTTNDSVTVDVPGGGGGNITYGTDEPAASQGSDGDVYFRYDYAGVDSLLPDSYWNLNNWTKNGAAFTRFDNAYLAAENKLIQKGGNGYERVFVPIPIEQNTDYVFALLYYTPTGAASGYSGQLNIKASFASKSVMESSAALSSYVSMTNLSIAAASDYSSYSLTFNSGSNTSVYLVIDLNITDNYQCELDFKNLAFYKAGDTPTGGQKIITKAYLKQSGAWVDAIGATID